MGESGQGSGGMSGSGGSGGMPGSGGAGASGGAGGTGGESGSAGEGGGDPNAGPVITVEFPVASLTDRTELTVRGRVSDPDGDAIEELTVQGVSATIETDGQWSATVPLELGVNELSIEATDERDGQGSETGPSVERIGYFFATPGPLAVDPLNNRAFAIDAYDDALIEIELGSGGRQRIGEPAETASGIADLELDITGGRALALANGDASLTWIDLTTGERTPLATLNAPASPRRLCVDLDGSRAFVLDSAQARMSVVDLDSGSQSVIPASASALGSAVDIEFDPDGDRLLLVTQAALLAIDPVTGNSTVVSDNMVGTGERFYYPQRLLLDRAAGRALLFVVHSEPAGGGGHNTRYVMQVDLETGDRKQLAQGPDNRSSLELSEVGVAFLPNATTGGSVLVLDELGRLIDVRLRPGQRSVFSSPLYGNGPTGRWLESVSMVTLPLPSL
jgi:DNA-binding beta-propeller fold protein YncE